MSIPEAVSILYSSLWNTWLNNTINHFVETFKHKSFLIWLKQDNSLPEHKILLTSAIEILDDLIASENDFLSHDILNLDDIEKIYLSWDISILKDSEVKKMDDYKKTIELLEKSKKLWSTYAICLLGILKSSPEYLTLIWSAWWSVWDQETRNWLWLKNIWTMWEHSKWIYKYHFLIEEAANKWDQYALYVLWDMYIWTDKQDKWIELLEKSYEQWNVDAAFRLWKFYYSSDSDLSMQYLAHAAGNLHLGAVHLMGNFFYDNNLKDSANDIWKNTANIGHIESLITYMRYGIDNSNEKDEFYGSVVEKISNVDSNSYRILKRNKDDLVSYEKQKISTDRMNTIRYKCILEQIKTRMESNFPSLDINIELLLETIFFKRDLWSLVERTDDSNVLWIYLSKDNEIGIDWYLHLGVMLHIKWIREFVTYILSHEIIHQISNSHIYLPRFLNEGITEAINGEIMWQILGYPNEVNIFKKLSEFSNINKDVLYDWLLNWQSQKIKNLLDANIRDLINYFSQQEWFSEDILREMNDYNNLNILLTCWVKKDEN